MRILCSSSTLFPTQMTYTDTEAPHSMTCILTSSLSIILLLLSLLLLTQKDEMGGT